MDVNQVNFPLVSGREMSRLDKLASSQWGIPSLVLMEIAAERLFERVMAYAPTPRTVTVFAGAGNNGGDALACARRAWNAGLLQAVLLDRKEDAFTGLAQIQLEILKKDNVPCYAPPWTGYEPAPHALCVDGWLGTGFIPPLRPQAYELLQLFLKLSFQTIIAVDIPSGLGSNGEPVPATDMLIPATETLSFGLPKHGLPEPAAHDIVGDLHVSEAGFPPTLLASAETDDELVFASLMLPLPDDQIGKTLSRSKASSKKDYGHILIIGGSPGYEGAARYAAQGAWASGIGLVSWLAHPNSLCSMRDPSTMSIGIDDVTYGHYDSVVMGPGLGTSSWAEDVYDRVLRDYHGPLLLDADALRFIKNPEALAGRAETLLTPHPGELSRLIKREKKDWYRSWESTVAQLALFPPVLVRDVTSVLVTLQKKRQWFYGAAPAWARGGSGDILAGFIGGLAAQGLCLTDAASMGVKWQKYSAHTLDPHSRRLGCNLDDLLAFGTSVRDSWIV